MNAIIIDASVAVKWPIIEPYTTEARALRDHALHHAIPLIAPALFGYEVTSVLKRKVFEGFMTLTDAQLALADILAIVQLRHFSRPLALRALEISDLARQKLAYDAQYLALAQQLACDFWTADKHFYDEARAAFLQVRWIGLYQTTVL